MIVKVTSGRKFNMSGINKNNLYTSENKFRKCFRVTVKLVYNDHTLDPEIVAVVDRWSLCSGHLGSKTPKWDLKMVVVIDMWSLFGGGR